MKIEIDGLYEVIKLKKAVEVMKDAFEKYPKLLNAFPDKKGRMAALEATLWYYLAYDMHYGKLYTLSEEVNEIVSIIHSKYANYSKFRALKAGSYSNEYQDAKEKMTIDQRKLRLRLFAELDKLEKTVPLPKEYLYINFFGVVQSHQGQGKGTLIMEKICEYADSVKLPIMLFTNTKSAAEFYESFAFDHVKTTVSETYGFENDYMIRMPEAPESKA